MPYIPPVKRPEFDTEIFALARKLADNSGEEGSFCGNLNYCLTRVMLVAVKFKFKKIRYWIACEMEGVLGHIAKELYRRKIVKYEDLKIAENGDVPEYEEEW